MSKVRLDFRYREDDNEYDVIDISDEARLGYIYYATDDRDMSYNWYFYGGDDGFALSYEYLWQITDFLFNLKTEEDGKA